jgi:hypothetical protein
LEKFEADLLVVQGLTRTFSGSWAPISPWSSVSASSGRLVLIRRRPLLETHPTLIVMGAREARNTTLISGLALAAAGDDVVLYLLGGGSESEIAALEQAAGSYGGTQKRRIRVEVAPPQGPGLDEIIARLRPALVVINPVASDGDVFEQVMAKTKGDILLVPDQPATPH